MFAVSIIYVNHRKAKLSPRLSCEQTVNTRRCFLSSSEQIHTVSGTLTMKKICKISSVIYHKIRTKRKSSLQMLGICIFVNSVTGVYFKTVGGKCGGNIILSGKRIAARYTDVCSSGFQGKRKISGFSFEMYRH